MRIARIHIRNFRSVLDQEIELDRLTVVVGPNGAGKSAVLRALDAFYDLKFTATDDDFYNRAKDTPIRIAVTYVDLCKGRLKSAAGGGRKVQHPLPV